MSIPAEIQALLDAEPKNQDGTPVRGRPLKTYAQFDGEGNIIGLVKSSNPAGLPSAAKEVEAPDCSAAIADGFKVDSVRKKLVERTKKMSEEIKERAQDDEPQPLRE